MQRPQDTLRETNFGSLLCKPTPRIPANRLPGLRPDSCEHVCPNLEGSAGPGKTGNAIIISPQPGRDKKSSVESSTNQLSRLSLVVPVYPLRRCHWKSANRRSWQFPLARPKPAHSGASTRLRGQNLLCPVWIACDLGAVCPTNRSNGADGNRKAPTQKILIDLSNLKRC